MTLWERWKHTSLPNKLLVVASTLMALGSLSSGVVAYFQYRMLQKQSDSLKEQSQVMQQSLQTLRDQATSTVYLTMRDRYFEVWNLLPDHYEDLDVKRNDNNWKLFKRYWYVSFDEWYVTRKNPGAFHDLWPGYYEHAYLRSLDKKSMRASLCILREDEFKTGVNREFVTTLEELYTCERGRRLCN